MNSRALPLHMKIFTRIFTRICPHHLKMAFTAIVFLKFVLLLFVLDGSIQIYKAETDADYYDWFARGLSPDAYSIWSYLLLDLYEFELYNRTVLTVIIFSLSTLVTPFLYASLIPHVKEKARFLSYNKLYWCVVIYISLYPTLNLYSLDIFRDAVMVFLVGLTFFTMKAFDSQQGLSKYALMVFVLALYLLIYQFRVYLAIALVVAFFLRLLNVYKFRPILLASVYLSVILIIRSLGWLDPLLDYRAQFEAVGGSSLGISLKVDNPVLFVSNYILSVLYQFYGLHINTFTLLILFLTESILIIASTIYIYLNRTYISKFEEYLLLFAIVYAAIWTFFNDNMGTAMRLRMFDYLAILIVAASLYIRRLNAISHTKDGP